MAPRASLKPADADVMSEPSAREINFNTKFTNLSNFWIGTLFLNKMQFQHSCLEIWVVYVIGWGIVCDCAGVGYVIGWRVVCDWAGGWYVIGPGLLYVIGLGAGM